MIAGSGIGAVVFVFYMPKLRDAPARLALPIAAATGLVLAATGFFLWGLWGLPTVLAGAGTIVGSAIGVFLVALGIRFLATARYWRLWHLRFPLNYRKLVWCTSPRQRPELIPGFKDGETQFAVDAIWRRLRTQNNFQDRCISLVRGAAWFVPSFLYRFSLKSVFWVWWPVALLTGPPQHARNPELFAARILDSDRRRHLLPFSWMTIIVFFGVNAWAFYLGPDAALLKGEPLVIVGAWFVLFGLSTLPWQWFGLASAALTIWVRYPVKDAVIDLRHAQKTGDFALEISARKQFKRIELVHRCAVISSVFYVFFGATLLVLTINRHKCLFSVPPPLQAAATLVHGAYAAPPLACERPSTVSQHNEIFVASSGQARFND
jgi:hypothetical protein